MLYTAALTRIMSMGRLTFLGTHLGKDIESQSRHKTASYESTHAVLLPQTGLPWGSCCLDIRSVSCLLEMIV